MCVIAFSPKGVDIPTEKQIKQMWEHNPDGAGYAYVNKKGKVVYRKGFMSVDSLLRELEAPERFKNTNFALHFRIGTSGRTTGQRATPSQSLQTLESYVRQRGNLMPYFFTMVF